MKVYVFSFRNDGELDEECMNMMMNDLMDLMDGD
ncbi:hypothetical protein [Staphylococcus auricularis]